MGKNDPSNSIEPSIVSILAAMIVVIAALTVAFMGDFGFSKITVLPTEPTKTAQGLPSSMATMAPSTSVLNTQAVDFNITPTPSIAGELVQLIANYYGCINSANPNQDDGYEYCWNLLSNKPGEFQSNLNKDDYKAFWKQYKVSYSLYFCAKNLQNYIDAKYYLYSRSDLSHPIGTGDPFYLEWSFALDENGWRIKGADGSIKEIGSYCESQPRAETLTPTP